MPIPLRSDRSAWDTINYSDLHARDIENGQALYHLPKGALADQVPQWDGEKWVPVAPPGGGGEPMWYVAGRLAPAQNVSAGILITRECTVEAIYAYAKTPGNTGATTIDINLDGVSIFGANQEPSLLAGDPDRYVKVILATPLALVEGNVLTLDIDAAAADAADLSVVMALVGSGGSPSGGGGTGDMIQAVYDTDGDGAVNNAEALEGHPASYFATADHTHTGYAPIDHAHASYATADHTHAGMGDMLKGTYDQDNDGVVDNAGALQGHPAADFAAADHTHPAGAISSTIVIGWRSTNAIAAPLYEEISLPFAGVITGWRIVADQPGSCSIDLWKDTYANYPPTVSDSICGASLPGLSSAAKNEDTTLAGWVTAFSAGDTLKAKLVTSAAVTRVTLIITYTRS